MQHTVNRVSTVWDNLNEMRNVTQSNRCSFIAEKREEILFEVKTL